MGGCTICTITSQAKITIFQKKIHLSGNTFKAAPFLKMQKMLNLSFEANKIALFWYLEHCEFQQLDLAAVSGIVGGGQKNREHIFPACYEVIKPWGSMKSTLLIANYEYLLNDCTVRQNL